MAKTSDILEIISMLVDYYGEKHEPSELQLALYVKALEDIDRDALIDAAAEHIKASPFFPKVSELRLLAQKAHPVTSRAYEDEQAERYEIHAHAWEMMARRLRREITDEQYDSDRAVQWVKRDTGKHAVDDTAAWELAQRQTEAWLAEDCGPNWRDEHALAGVSA